MAATAITMAMTVLQCKMIVAGACLTAVARDRRPLADGISRWPNSDESRSTTLCWLSFMVLSTPLCELSCCPTRPGTGRFVVMVANRSLEAANVGPPDHVHVVLGRLLVGRHHGSQCAGLRAVESEI